MGGFLSSIFTGSDPGLHKSQQNLNSLAGFSSNAGETGTNAAMGYDQGILSGDPTKVAQTLAPEIKTLGEQAQQNKNTVAQFGNRGGGMNSVMAGLDDATRAKLISLMGSLRRGAAQNLGQLGTANLQLGQSGNMDAAQIAQMEHQNQQNGLLNKIFSGGVGMLMGGKMPFNFGSHSTPSASSINSGLTELAPTTPTTNYQIPEVPMQTLPL